MRFKRLRFVVVILLSLCFLSPPAPLHAEEATPMVLEGTFSMSHTATTACAVVVPPTTSGSIKLVVDFSTGAVTGQFQGQGAGQKTITLCDSKDQPTTRQATAQGQDSYSGTITGRVDPQSGSLSGEIIVQGTISTSWIDCPTCGAVSGAYTHEAAITGVAKKDGSGSGQIAWEGDEERAIGQWTARGSPWVTPTPENRPPEITGLSWAPSAPTDKDILVITVQASDPDGDKLTYDWYVNGGKQPTSSNSVTWRLPRADEHTVQVIVSDGKGGTAKTGTTITVVESDKPADRDEDGVPDEDDKCPDVRYLSDDGCPPFEAKVGCQQLPGTTDKFACTVTVAGRHTGEDLAYEWWLDNTGGTGSGKETEVFTIERAGTYFVKVNVTGVNRWTSADTSLVVAELTPLALSLGLTPDPPVAGKLVIGVATVSGQLPSEQLTYEWKVNGKNLCQTSTCAWEAVTGTNDVNVVVRGSGSREETAGRQVLAAVPGAPALQDADAPFAAALACDANITSDDTLECTATINRTAGQATIYSIEWFIDGAAAGSAQTGNREVYWSLGTPAPGDHLVQARVADLSTNRVQTASAKVTVTPGSNAAIPPTNQAAAAGGTVAAAGAWLWLEYLRRKWEEAEEAKRVKQEAQADAALQADRQKWFDQESKPWEDAHSEKAMRDKRYTYRDGVWIAPADPELARRLAEAQKAYAEAKRKKQEIDAAIAMLRAQHEIVCKSATFDAIIECADVLISLGMIPGGASAPGSSYAKRAAQAYAREWLQNSIKAGYKDYLEHEAGLGGLPGPGEVFDDYIWSGVGVPHLPPTWGKPFLPDGLTKWVLTDPLDRWAIDAKAYRYYPEAVRFNPRVTDYAPSLRRGEWATPPTDDAVGLGTHIGVLENYVTMIRIGVERGVEADNIRQQLKAVYEDVATYNARLVDAESELFAAKAALDARPKL